MEFFKYGLVVLYFIDLLLDLIDNQNSNLFYVVVPICILMYIEIFFFPKIGDSIIVEHFQPIFCEPKFPIILNNKYLPF